MKRRISQFLVLGMIAALVLSGCGKKDDSKSLVGNWQATLEMADTLNESFAADPTMGEYIKIDSFALKMDLALNDDGSFSMSLNEASVTDAFNGVKEPLKKGMTDYMEATTGMTVDDLSAAGIDLDSLVDEMMSPDTIASSLGDTTESGNFVAKDGKLYFLDAGETKPSDNSENMPYTLSGNTLTLNAPEGGDLGELAEFFPLEFTKQ